MTKLAFFDIDGTLCVPRYKDKYGKYVCGFTDAEWFEFCENSGKEGYRNCITVKPVERYAHSLKEKGVKLFVLSTAQSFGEIEAKKAHILETFPSLFEEVITVEHDSIKMDVIKEYADRFGCELRECEIVEDTYSTILKANDLGIKATHISMIVCDL